ncbi:MAG: GAF domain-containing sensor histidine kinase [Desulfobulbaceae bacterium]|nr:GAF domain-containing sensor histidine kinase [Desulfobulbaceae bacterium]
MKQSGASAEIFSILNGISPDPAGNTSSISADHYFDILHSLDAIIFVADIRTHEIFYANNYAQSLLGNILGKTCRQALRGDSSEPCSFCSTRYLPDNNPAFPVSLNHETWNSITRGWYDVYERPVTLPDGRNVRIHLAMDITDKKTEEKTKLNELRLSTLVSLYEKKELDPASICEFVLESSIPITSSSIGFMGFLTEDESQMTIHSWSKNVMQECAMHQKSPEFNMREGGIWDQAIREKRPFMLNDFTLDSPGRKEPPKGHVAIRRFLAVPHLFNGKIVAVIAVGNKEEPYGDDDVIQLQLLLEGMWQILRRKKAEEEAIRHSEQVRHFANAVAHDLKSPAISVYGFAKMLKEKYADALDNRALRYCEQIMKNSEQISSLAGDINLYISTRDTPCTFESLELQEIWYAIRQEFIPQLRDKNINWFEQEIESVRIMGNRTGLLRIFRNLIDNALKYGGDSMSTISMGYEMSGTHHILLVENNGEGILQEDEKVIFQEFIRNSKGTKAFGTGMGLAIVREVAAKHNGQSWLMTSPQGNPVFCVSIARDLHV